MVDKKPETEVPAAQNPEIDPKTEAPAAGGEEKLSKNALKKQQKEAEKAKQKELNMAKQATQQAEEDQDDISKEFYGDLQMVQSQKQTNRVWSKILDLNDSSVNSTVLVRARVQSSRPQGNLAFIVLRQQFSTIQIIGQKSEKISKQMIKFMAKIPNESIVDVTGVIVKPDKPVESCSQQVEIIVSTIHVVSRSLPELPLQISDASRLIEKGDNEMDEEVQGVEAPSTTSSTSSTEKSTIKVLMPTRLDNRVIDLRTVAKQAIFRVSSGVCQLFREFLYKENFMEIHTPKLIGGTSEGGANVFRLDYFGKQGCLAQSPQLYKQMCINADFDRVFEIAPVFRAENSFTHRHMCEFTGLDIEMSIKEHYFEALELFGDLFAYIFHGLETRYGKELEAIKTQYPFEPFKMKYPVVKLTFEQGIALLKEAGTEWPAYEDLSTEVERKLGAIVKAKYDTDFYMLHKYPKNARPFYTMLSKENPNYTNSYDMFMRGEEIVSGAQRLHDPVLLAKRAEECGIQVETLQDYIDSFQYGTFPHAGMGVGLERVVFLFCALNNIRNASLFPRDPKRLTP